MMNILELLENFIKNDSTTKEKEVCQDYYITLKNLYSNVKAHEIFEIEFDDLCIVDKTNTEDGGTYIAFYLVESNKNHVEYRIYLRYEMRWLGYEDDYQIPVIDIKKVEYMVTHEYKGDETLLCNEQGWYYLMEDEEEVEYSIDEIHREALIENYEREIKKLVN